MEQGACRLFRNCNHEFSRSRYPQQARSHVPRFSYTPQRTRTTHQCLQSGLMRGWEQSACKPRCPNLTYLVFTFGLLFSAISAHNQSITARSSASICDENAGRAPAFL
jgi:hypothetical protein